MIPVARANLGVGRMEGSRMSSEPPSLPHCDLRKCQKVAELYGLIGITPCLSQGHFMEHTRDVILFCPDTTEEGERSPRSNCFAD